MRSAKTPRAMSIPANAFRACTFALSLLTLTPGLALAQSAQAVNTVPLPLGQVNASSAVASTNAFQALFSAAGPQGGVAIRNGCLIVNTGTTALYVFFGAIAAATTPKSIPLKPAGADGSDGGRATCEAPGSGGALQDAVSVTGTTAKTFFAIRY